MNSSFTRTMVINCTEPDLRSIVDKTSEECPGISIKFSLWIASESTFEVTLSSSSEAITNKAEGVFRFLLPTNALKSRFTPDSRQSIDKLMKYSSDHEFVKKSIDSISTSLNDYKPEEICIAYNGGKDCTALLHMVYSIFIQKYPNNKLNAFYVEIPETFPSLENFVQKSVESYQLNLISVCSRDYKQALKILKEKSSIKAIFMGTRTSDLPVHVKLNELQMTDPDWPQFLRISPMLKWSYSQVWSFLRDNDVLYCSLYDRGYTSIGTTKNTTQNPLLKYISRNGETFYMPAYMLTDVDHERSGRT